MRRVAFVALAVVSACGAQVVGTPAPLDTFYKPSGAAVHEGKLLVASSNFDLLYESANGGTVIGVDPAPAGPRPPLLGSVRFASFTGDLVIADAGACGIPESLALVPTRSTMSLYPLRIAADGALSCDGCAIPLGGGEFGDPLPMGVACGAGRHSAFVSYLRSSDGTGWITEYDLFGTGVTPHGSVGSGPVRGFAFDASSGRLWMTGLATGTQTPLRWLDLRGGCAIDSVGAAGTPPPCVRGTVATGELPLALELHGIALANPGAAGQGPGLRRVYLTGRLYDLGAAATAGGRTVDLGGLLVVADLVDNAAGRVDAHVVRTLSIGYGAADVRVLPLRPGRRDVVAALGSDDGTLTVYDDDTHALAVIGLDDSPDNPNATGAPLLGHTPYGIAVDPTIRPDGKVRLYVPSFVDSFVTPVDVPLDDVDHACVVTASGDCIVLANPQPRRIQGGTQ